MGKTLAVGGVIIVLALIAAVVTLILRRVQHREKAAERGWAVKGDLSRTQERQLLTSLDSAQRLLTALAAPPKDLYGEQTILTTDDRTWVNEWLENYSNLRKDLS